MAAYIFTLDASLDSVIEEAGSNAGRLRAYPYTSALAADFDAFIAECKVTMGEDVDLRIARTAANAVAGALDDDLNDLSDATAKTLLIITKNDATDPEFVFYFGPQRPSDFKKPQLGDQLKAMMQWVTPMAKSPHQTLVDLGTLIGPKVADATTAVANQDKAEADIRAFRTTGHRRQLIDKFNALRKSTYGALAQIPHAHPELKLPASFADRFFRAERPAKAPTLKELEDKLAAAQQQVKDIQQQIDDLKKAMADAEAAKKQKQSEEDQKALADAQSKLQDLQAKITELENKLKTP